MYGNGSHGSMDDLNFNESLDALLNSENLTEGSNALQTDVTVSDSVALRMSHLEAQGMPTTMTSNTAGPASATGMNGPSHSMMYQGRLQSIPYTISTTSHPSQASSVSSFATNSYMQPAQRPNVAAPTSFPSYQPQPIAPAPIVPYSNASVLPAATNKKTLNSTFSKKRSLDPTAVSEDEDDKSKRRHGRNLREQQRSQKITEQIDHLREVLASANIEFKPDKYSTLVTVADYIKQLQAKSAALDADHKKLISTISKTNELANGQYIPASTSGQDVPGGFDLGKGSTSNDDFDGVFVPNIDYRSVFGHCGMPLAVASIDGLLLDCNAEFLKVAGYSREELLPSEKLSVIAEETPSSAGAAAQQQKHDEAQASAQNMSLFNLLSRDHMEGVFLAMSQMLKKAPKNAKPNPGEDCWAGDVCLGRLPDTKVCSRFVVLRCSWIVSASYIFHFFLLCSHR